MLHSGTIQLGTHNQLSNCSRPPDTSCTPLLEFISPGTIPPVLILGLWLSLPSCWGQLQASFGLCNMEWSMNAAPPQHGHTPDPASTAVTNRCQGCVSCPHGVRQPGLPLVGHAACQVAGARLCSPCMYTHEQPPPLGTRARTSLLVAHGRRGACTRPPPPPAVAAAASQLLASTAAMEHMRATLF